jgi:flavin reductase (DIM6/NTAB) family NADH-FMN oxidoreductase RutF
MGGRSPTSSTRTTSASLPIDPSEFRRALGRFATGIAVVTTVHDRQVHGMTANGFASVSLRPPLVLVSLANGSKLHRLLTASRRYGVSVLREQQEDLSRHFAAQGGSAEVAFVWRREMPLLEGALAHLVCAVDAVHVAGDHTLYIGEVEYLEYSSGSPLLFYTGEYGRLDVKLWDHSYIWKPDPWS